MSACFHIHVVSEPYSTSSLLIRTHTWDLRPDTHRHTHMCECDFVCRVQLFSAVEFTVTTKPTACCATLTNVHHGAVHIYHSLKTCSSFRRQRWKWKQKKNAHTHAPHTCKTVSMCLFRLGGHLQNDHNFFFRFSFFVRRFAERAKEQHIWCHYTSVLRSTQSAAPQFLASTNSRSFEYCVFHSRLCLRMLWMCAMHICILWSGNRATAINRGSGS